VFVWYDSIEQEMYIGFTKETGVMLTAKDLENIGALIEKSESRLSGRIDGLESRFDGLESRIDRMETRLLFSIELIQRDGFEQLENHERRISKLEKIQTR
jgi:hypothetical protein